MERGGMTWQKPQPGPLLAAKHNSPVICRLPAHHYFPAFIFS
jgi:hypothetical protein